MSNHNEAISDENSSYVVTNLPLLINMKYEVSKLSILPKMPVQTMLTGKHHSRKRGRGLDFEEVRKYVFGDDIRNIDWKVTARTKTTYTKVFTEERERPVLVVVDQSASMFFGSTLYTKSVIAAQMASIAAWKVLAVGDRIGAIVYNDNTFEYIKPRRSRQNVQTILKNINTYNNNLVSENASEQKPMLNKILFEVNQTITHDFLVIILSDFKQFDDKTRKELINISHHNEVILGNISDAMEDNFPMENITISDGEHQIELSIREKDKIEKIRNNFESKRNDLQKFAKQYRMTLAQLRTDESASTQLKRMLQQ